MTWKSFGSLAKTDQKMACPRRADEIVNKTTMTSYKHGKHSRQKPLNHSCKTVFKAKITQVKT